MSLLEDRDFFVETIDRWWSVWRISEKVSPERLRAKFRALLEKLSLLKPAIVHGYY